jgi:hypothetical protein
MSGIDESIETENRLVVSKIWDWGLMGTVYSMGTRSHFGMISIF